jgi:hypothetical protein
MVGTYPEGTSAGERINEGNAVAGIRVTVACAPGAEGVFVQPAAAAMMQIMAAIIRG